MNFTELMLANTCDFINGGAWSDQEYVESGIPVVKVTNMVAGTIDTANMSYLPFSSYEKYKKHELRVNDLIVSTVGSHPTQPGSVVGRISVIPKHLSGAFLNQNAVCIRVARPELISQRFLIYICQTRLFKHHVESRARGSANQVRMAIGELKQFTFRFPPLETQKKIAAILSAYDDLIENNKRRIALLEKMAEEIYREWFVRFRFPGWQNTDFDKGIPKGWEQIFLGTIAKIVMGQSPKSEFYNTDGDGLPFHQGVSTYGERFPINEIFCSVEGKLAYEGDILFSVRAPVGRLNIASEKIIIGRGLSSIRHKENYQSYLYYLLKIVFLNEDIIGNGSIFNSVSKDELNGFKIFQPSKSLIADFENIASSIDKKIFTLIKSIEFLEKTKNQLLPRLISGKLSVENLNIQYPPSMQIEESNSKS